MHRLTLTAVGSGGTHWSRRVHSELLATCHRLRTSRPIGLGRSDTVSASRLPLTCCSITRRGHHFQRKLSRTSRKVWAHKSRLLHRAKAGLGHREAASAVANSIDIDDEYKMKDLEEDIDRFSVSTSSHILPEEIFYKPDDHSIDLDYISSNSTLSGELGVDSIWERQGGDEEHRYRRPLEEEQYFSNEQLGSLRETTGDKGGVEAKFDTAPERQRSAIDFLKQFDELDRPSPDNPEAFQLWLECAAQHEASMKYQKVIESARSRRDFDSMGILQSHVVQWYQAMRDTIDARQKEYLSNQDKRIGRERYGPLICSLAPEKLAVIVAHEATTMALLNGEKGVILVEMATAIGVAVETEVLSQHTIRARFGPGADTDNIDSDDDEESSYDDRRRGDRGDFKRILVDRWNFSASHLTRFMEELKYFDPNFKKNKRSIEQAVRRAKRATNAAENWVKEDLVHLGVALLSILLECATVDVDGNEQSAFYIEKIWTKKNKTTSYVYLNKQTAKLFLKDDFVSLAATTTRHTPMVVPPSDWVSPDSGGYKWLKADIMRYKNSNTLKEALHQADISQILDGLNVLGRTPWSINRTILEIGQRCWENNLPCGDIPSRDDFVVPPEPIKPSKIHPELYADKECEEYKAFVAERQAYREASTRRTRIHQKNMVSIGGRTWRSTLSLRVILTLLARHVLGSTFTTKFCGTQTGPS